jgi:hypothetical protein
MKLVFSADEAALEKLIEEIEQKVYAAEVGAVHDVADLAIKQGRANIAGAGFSSRWQRALTYSFYPNKGSDPAAVIFDRIPFANVFEFGMTIQGRPLLWLPIEQNLPQGVHSPKQYGRKLVSVNIAGKPPLMFDAANRLAGPLFVGVSSVNIRKRWDLMRIFAAAVARLDEFYQKRLKG